MKQTQTPMEDRTPIELLRSWAISNFVNEKNNSGQIVTYAILNDLLVKASELRIIEKEREKKIADKAFTAGHISTYQNSHLNEQGILYCDEILILKDKKDFMEEYRNSNETSIQEVGFKFSVCFSSENKHTKDEIVLEVMKALRAFDEDCFIGISTDAEPRQQGDGATDSELCDFAASISNQALQSKLNESGNI